MRVDLDVNSLESVAVAVVGDTDRGFAPTSAQMLAPEDLADTCVLEDRVERRSDDRRDRQHLDLVDLLVGWQRESVGHGDLL